MNTTNSDGSFDAVIIGAGVSGLYQLYRLREMGLSVRVFETGTDVGGTWYWNRYPGARFDSESYTYQYSFSEELLDEWQWSEHFAAQPETLRYLNFVADKFDLRRDIQFESRVQSAVFDEDANAWDVTVAGRSADGQPGPESAVRCRYLITAIGALSAPQMPAIDGIDSFAGRSWHTTDWPREPVDFTDKRVAVIGTGATAVQLIQELAKSVGELTIFQRRPNWCAPLHNGPITDDEQREIRENWAETLELCKNTVAGFKHEADRRKAMELDEDERIAFYEQKYAEPGFGIWLGTFRDVLVDEAANKTITDFVADKIRSRVDDPALAEKLIPTDHGFGTRRVPMENGYYEVYNQDNVHLVDLNDTPIERVTPSGIRCGGSADPGTSEPVEHEFDYIVYATGFDAVTGAFDRLDIRGVGGRSLKESWDQGVTTYLGLQTVGFPNLFTLVGPHNASTFCNMPRCIEQNVEFVGDTIGYLGANGHERIEATVEAAEAWTEHVHESASRLLMTKVDSWFMGINSNLEHKQKPQFLLYAGGLGYYRDRCDEIAANGYEGFVLS